MPRTHTPSLRAFISALTAGRLRALQLSLPPHATPRSPPPLPSLPPSREARRREWQAGGRGRDLGAPSQEANRCSPSGVSQMADIKKSLGGGEGGVVAAAAAAAGAEKDENIPQDEQATESCTFLFPPCFDCDSPGFILHFFFSPFLQLFGTAEHLLILLPSPGERTPLAATKFQRQNNTCIRQQKTNSSPPSLFALLVSSS